MDIDYTSRSNATYILLDDCPDDWPEVLTEEVTDGVLVDTTAEGTPLGIELLFAPASLTEAHLAPIFERWPALQSPLAEALAGVGANLRTATQDRAPTQ